VTKSQVSIPQPIVAASTARRRAPCWRQDVGRGGALGGVHFGMAIAAGRVLVPITDFADGAARPEPAHPGVYALNLADGHVVWRALAGNACAGRKFCQPGYSASITVAGPLVLAGSTDGHLRIFGASDGKMPGSVLLVYDVR